MNLAMQGVSYVFVHQNLRGGGDIGDNSRHKCQKTESFSSQLEIMVSSTSSISTPSNFIKECARFGKADVGARGCDKCGKIQNLDVPMGTPSATLDNGPSYEHTAFLEYLSKRTPQSIVTSCNLAAYKARANWYNTGSEAGSIVWRMRHNPGGDPTFKAQQAVMNDLLAFIKLMPYYVFASRFQYLVVDKSLVEGRVVEDTDVHGCYVHDLSFRVVAIGLEDAQFGNDTHHKHLKWCMPLHVKGLYEELDATLQRSLEPTVHTATACTLLATILSSIQDQFPPMEFCQTPQTPQTTEIPLAHCALCAEFTVGELHCDTCGFRKGQSPSFDNQQHVLLLCKRLNAIFAAESDPKPPWNGVLLRTLMDSTDKKSDKVSKLTLLNKVRKYREQHGITTPVDPTFDVPANGLEVLQAYHAFLQNQYDEQQHQLAEQQHQLARQQQRLQDEHDEQQRQHVRTSTAARNDDKSDKSACVEVNTL